MAEYIEREALLEKLQERDLYLCVSESDIKDAPAADVALVVHGRWLPYENEQDKGFHYCSVCNCQAFNYEDGSEVVEVLSNYCPNCGAKMDKEETDGLDTP